MAEIKRSPCSGTITNHYPSLHRVHVTKELDPHRTGQLRDFISKHIDGYGGRAEESHGLPLMLFQRRQDASRFADEFSQKINIPRQHIAVKAWR